jgi:hypothetical protein
MRSREDLEKYQLELNGMLSGLEEIRSELKKIDKEFLNNEYSDSYKIPLIITVIDGVKWPIFLGFCFTAFLGLVYLSNGACA